MNLIVKCIPSTINNFIQNQVEKQYKYSNFRSYSQEGEDLILKKYFDTCGVEKGFYVDVGAHHPQRFSNTYMFYCKGWRGINIDATPDSMVLFNKRRPDDINVEQAVSDKPEKLAYYMFNEPALNTFSESIALKLDKENQSYFISSKKILETATLSSVLDKYIDEIVSIDLLSIDVEGFDYNVLKSLDFNKYRPGVILIEDLGNTLEKVTESRIYLFLSDLGYSLMSRTFNTLIFYDKNS